MDAKITKKRLAVMLSYDWIKIIAVAAVLVLVWTMLFSTFAARLTAAQEFTVFNYTGSTAGDGFSSSLTKCKSSGAFSYDIQKVSPQNLTAAGSEIDQIIDARFATGTGDVAVLAHTTQGVSDSVAYKRADGTEYKPTYLEQFAARYVSYMAEIESEETGFLAQTKSYLDAFYGGNATETASLDENEAEKSFRARVKRLKDKRFKKESEIRSGIEREKERIQSIRRNYYEFLGYLESGVVRLETIEVSVWYSEDECETTTGAYAINISPDQNSERLREFAYYYKTEIETDENGVEHKHSFKTSENITLVLLDPYRAEYEKYAYGKYESLSYVNYIVRNYVLAA